MSEFASLWSAYQTKARKRTRVWTWKRRCVVNLPDKLLFHFVDGNVFSKIVGVDGIVYKY